MNRIRTTLALGSVLFAGPALAQAPVFTADFDDGDLSAWSASCERENNFGFYGDRCLPPRADGGALSLAARSSCFSGPFDGVGVSLHTPVELAAGEYLVRHRVSHSTALYGFCIGGTGGDTGVLVDGEQITGLGAGIGGRCGVSAQPEQVVEGCFTTAGGTVDLAVRTNGGDCADVAGTVDDIEIIEVTAAPELDVPADVVLGCDGDARPEATGFATAQDACNPPEVTWFDTEVEGGCLPTIERTWVADDGVEQATAVQTIAFADDDAPTLDVEAESHCVWPPNGRMVCFEDFTAGAAVADSCDPAAGIVDVVCTATDGGRGATIDADDCTYDAATDTLCVRAERAGGRGRMDRVYDVKVVAADACGNAVEAPALTVTVPHSRRGHRDCR